MNTIIANAPILSLLAVLITYSASGQPAKPRDVVGTGGTITSNGHISLMATIGQPAIGCISDASNGASQGYWGEIQSHTTVSATAIPQSATTGDFGNVAELHCTPNPFSTSVEISLSIPHSSPVLLTISELSGKLVSTLMNEPRQEGLSMVTFDPRNLPSGKYLVRLVTDGGAITSIISLVK